MQVTIHKMPDGKMREYWQAQEILAMRMTGVAETPGARSSNDCF